MESGFRNLGHFYWWNPKSWALKSGIQLNESWILLTIAIQNPSSTDKHWNSVPEIRNPESRTVLDSFSLACVASVSNRVMARKLEWERKKKGVEGGGEKRKRLLANPTILENAGYLFLHGARLSLHVTMNKLILSCREWYSCDFRILNGITPVLNTIFCCREAKLLTLSPQIVSKTSYLSILVNDEF